MTSSPPPPPPCSKNAAAAGDAPAPAARYCLCAPTTHPGSFRCRLHRSSSSSSSVDAKAAASEEAKEAAAAAAAARAFLERVTAARKLRRQQGVSGTVLLPGPSRLGATATDE